MRGTAAWFFVPNCPQDGRENLTVKNERKLEKEGHKDDYQWTESRLGKFSRSFSLPETIDLDKIKADYKDGILSMTMPRKPEVKPRQIAVHTN